MTDITRLHRALVARVLGSNSQAPAALHRAVGLAFDITNRLANAFDFAIADTAAMNAGAKHLLKRGYR
jgi:hypothetical protein